VLAVQHCDLPLFNHWAADAAELVRRSIADRPYLLGAGPHRLLGFPRGGQNAPAGLRIG
jgi:hypothetical protein